MKNRGALLVLAMALQACSADGGAPADASGNGGGAGSGGASGTGGTAGGGGTTFPCLGSDGVPPDGGAEICSIGETYCARQANKDGTYAAAGHCEPFMTSSTCPTINPVCGACVTEYTYVNCTCTSQNGEVVVTCKQI